MRPDTSPTRASVAAQPLEGRNGLEPTSLESVLGSKKAIVTRGVDTWLLAGFSVLLMLAILLLDEPRGRQLALSQFLIFQILINWPHFVVSWSILYGRPEVRGRHPWAVLYVPIAMVLYGGFALYMEHETKLYLDLLGLGTSCYLAVHYTGQAWGMIATFTNLEGMRPDKTERALIVSGLRIFLVWQVVWSLHYFGILTIRPPTAGEVALTKTALDLVTYLMPVAVLLGVAGFLHLRIRTGRTLPLRVILPWLQICLWYAVLAKYPGGIFWVQISHSLQYLMFPMRVEANRWQTKIDQDQEQDSPRRRIPVKAYVLCYAIGSVALAGLIFGAFPMAVRHFGFSTNIAFVVTNMVNIHHYFTDGAIWKMREPQVRHELFAHLR